MRLGAVIYPDFELLDLYGPLEMFGCLNDALPRLPVRRRWPSTTLLLRPHST